MLASVIFFYPADYHYILKSSCGIVLYFSAPPVGIVLGFSTLSSIFHYVSTLPAVLYSRPDPYFHNLPVPIRRVAQFATYRATWSLDAHLLLAGLGADGDDPTAQPQGQVLTIVSPGATVHTRSHLHPAKIMLYF